MSSENKPVLIYDGDCGFCRSCVAKWSPMTQDRVTYVSSQETAKRFPEISPERFESSIQLVQPDGTVFQGAEAVFRALAFNPSHRWPLWLYRNIWGVAEATEFAYRFVARNRKVFSRLMR